MKSFEESTKQFVPELDIARAVLDARIRTGITQKQCLSVLESVSVKSILVDWKTKMEIPVWICWNSRFLRWIWHWKLNSVRMENHSILVCWHFYLTIYSNKSCYKLTAVFFYFRWCCTDDYGSPPWMTTPLLNSGVLLFPVVLYWLRRSSLDGHTSASLLQRRLSLFKLKQVEMIYKDLFFIESKLLFTSKIRQHSRSYFLESKMASTTAWNSKTVAIMPYLSDMIWFHIQTKSFFKTC